MDRRNFLAISGMLAATVPGSGFLKTYSPDASQIKAILFDGFALFDPRPVFKMANQIFPEKGAELVKEWRIRQFEYTWLRSMAGNYRDFFSITEDALLFAADLLGLTITTEHKKQLMDGYYQLPVWSEIPAALSRLKEAGFKLSILSNFTPEMLRINCSNNHIDKLFDHQISVDAVKKYKPHPTTYRLGMSAYHLSKEEILFVPFAGWDAAGSKTFGYQTFWVNGLQQPRERLGDSVDGMGKNLTDLLTYLHI